MVRSLHEIGFAFLLTLCIGSLCFAQYTIPPKPGARDFTYVYNPNNILSSSQARALNLKLSNYADSTSTQIVVAVIPTTKGEDISLLGAKWGQAWAIGQAKEDNGILVLLAKDDRKVDINTGYGIESIISDRDAKRVIENFMIPQFKKGNYYNGLEKGTTALTQMLEGTFKGTAKRNPNHYSLKEVILSFAIIIIIVILLKGGNRGGRGRGPGDPLRNVIIFSNMGRSSWGGSPGGSSWSGGGSFGGGSFGGGGASGGW